MPGDDPIRGLPDANVTLSGAFGPGVDVASLHGAAPDLFPVTIDTGRQPNPAAIPLTAFTVTIGDRAWTFPVDHVDLLGSNKVRLWLRRSAVAVGGVEPPASPL
jgi:hypothetical protein